MPKKKPDFSRMITLDLAPSEAHQLASELEYLVTRGLEVEGEITSTIELYAGIADHLRRQLNLLLWPAKPGKKAPLPV